MNSVRGYDELAQMTYMRLYCDGDKKSRTFIGGVLSLLIRGYVMYIGIRNLVKMFIFETPYVKTIERGIEGENDDKVYLN